MLNADNKEIYDIINRYYPNKKHPKPLKFRIRKENVLRKFMYCKAFCNRSIFNATYNHLRKIFPNNEIIDWTDRKVYDCWQFKVLMHENQDLLDDDIELIRALNNQRKDLRIFISVLGKYYYYYIEETTYDADLDLWEVYNAFEIPDNIKEQVESLQSFFETQGYSYVTDMQAKQEAKNIHTEYIEYGKACVFDCLFTQIDGLLKSKVD